MSSKSSPPDKPSERRDHLVNTALKLFYRDGFHATGIDTILAESGVAKMTLYKHFKTKEDLILAALTRRDELWMTWFTSSVESRTNDPRARLLAIFDALESWFLGAAAPGKFHGCAFINSAAEYADFSHPIHQLASEHKQKMQAQISLWTHAAAVPDPTTLASQLTLLAEGAITLAHVNNAPQAAHTARQVAEKLLPPL